MNKPVSIISIIIFVCIKIYGQEIYDLQVPGKDLYAQIHKNGLTVLPSGRIISPIGKVTSITNDPFGLSLSSDGKFAVALHNGVLTIYNLVTDSVIRVPNYGKKNQNPFPKGSLIGASFNTDNKSVFLSGGDNGSVIEFDLEELQIKNIYSLNGLFKGKEYNDSFTSDLIYNQQEDELLVLDQANYRLVRIDCKSKVIKSSISVGRLPFGIAMSPDKKKVIVANVGMYAYPLIEGVNKMNYDSLMISHHPYAHQTAESINGTVIDGKKIPGVGDANVSESMSVYVIDLETNSVTAKLKTGHKVGEMIEGAEVIGGSSPNSIVVFRDYAYVTNANNDLISVIDYVKGKIVNEIPLQIDNKLDRYRGYIPFGIDINKDGSKIFVALLGFNAVAIIDTKTGKTIGLVPSGWGPTRVKLTADEQEIIIVSCRGYGAGPNGGRYFIPPVQGTYIGDIQLATFQRVPMPKDSLLEQYTKNVIDFTYIKERVIEKNHPIPSFPGEKKSPIKYVVYITKENRTYDEIFGKRIGGIGDSSLSRYGLGVDIKRIGNDSDSIMVENVDITPNHHKLSDQFASSDNFYCDGDASIHGHHWMMGVIPNEWVEVNSNTTKTAKLFSSAPGRRFPGSTGSMDPEDYAEIGGIWEALDRKKISFYNFGEANETAHVRESWSDTATGAGHGVMVPMQKALFSRTSHNYAGFNMNIPDQFRVQQFEIEFKKLWLSGKQKMPSLVTIQLPNDHGASIRPADGYPFPHSFIADNDLALGRILHFLSRTSYWKNMLVIITEDDSQGGVDHIDAHRSILMMAGPYVKKNYVSHTHANFGSILKLIYRILGVPYVNQYDLTASDLADFFNTIPDYSKYNLKITDRRVFDASKAMKKYNRDINWRSILKDIEMDDDDDLRETHYKNEQLNK